jgi:predicted nuclease of restriction endonuclease-like (RecB) superfamily
MVEVENKDKREICIAKNSNNHWTTGQLERQIDSSLYECLMKSNDNLRQLFSVKKF